MAADLTQLASESSEWCLATDVKLLAWLKGFSNLITQRTQDINRRLDSLSQETLGANAELENAFTSLHQLSNTQFVEQRIQEEDESTAGIATTNAHTGRPPIAPGPENFEQNVVPKYREAVHLAWSALGSQDRVCDSISAPKTSFGQECIKRPLPLILGTEAFLAEEYCGLPGPESERFSDAAQSSQEPHQIEAGHFASGGSEGKENEDGEKVEEQTLEEGWTQISSKKQYSELEPAVTAALNFRAMLEEALHGPSLYDQPSSLSGPQSVQEDDPSAATSPWQSPSEPIDLSVGEPESDSQGNVHNNGRPKSSRATRQGSISEAHSETEPTRDSFREKAADVEKDRREAVQHRERHVAFSTTDESSNAHVAADMPAAPTPQQSGRALVNEIGRAAIEEESDEDNFTFGALPRGDSEKDKSSYTINFDDLFRRKAPLEPSTSSDGRNAETSQIRQPRMHLSGKNPAVDAITAALKQRQAPENQYFGENSVENVPKTEAMHAGLTGAAKHGLTSPTQPLHSELSFGPVAGFGDNVREGASRLDAGGSGPRRTDHDRWRAKEVNNDGESHLPIAQLRDSAEGQGPKSEAEEREEGFERRHVLASNGDAPLSASATQSSSGWEAATRSPEGKRAKEGASRKERGSGLRRSTLFGDSDEEDDYALPLFGNKQSALGSRQRGLFEDSDEEEGLGFRPQASGQGVGLFGVGSEKDSRGGGGLFDDWEDQTDGLFRAGQGKSSEGFTEGKQRDVSGASEVSELFGSGRQASDETSTAARLPHYAQSNASDDKSKGLFERLRTEKSALSSDLFGDDHEDGDLFASSKLGRSSALQGAIRGDGKANSSRVSALLDEFSSDEEDPWENRLAKLKEDKRT